MIDASVVARVVGITTNHVNLRAGGVLFLPQRIALFAQGQSGMSYSTEKWLAPSAGAAGARYGYKSQIYLALRELLPANGDGVGTVPITVYPLEDADSGVAAVGDITPSGTPTEASAWRVRAGGILSDEFVIAAGEITGAALTAACRKIHEAISSVLHIPIVPTYTYGAITQEFTGTGDGTLGTFTTTGQPMPGVWTLKCTAAAADAGTFSLTNPDGEVVADDVTIGANTVAGLGFTLTDGATDFDEGDTFTITVPATKVTCTVAWKGESGNDLKLEVLGEDGTGVSFAITQPTGGLVNPSVDGALEKVGDVWETMALNCLNVEDTTALDAYQTFGEGRWGELVRKPLVVFTGNTHTTVADATAVSSVRRTDRVNAQLVAPGSPDLPFRVAARQLARIARVANNNPPRDYGSQRATGLIPGSDGEQWNHMQRDQAVKAGSSTVQVKDGVVNISDVVTFYRPTGEEPPAYRYVVDIVKLQNIIFNLDLNFATAEWDGAPLIPDDQPTVNPQAKKPKMAKALAAAIIDSLALNAILSDPASAKASLVANINAQNPKRLDLSMTVALSGNTNVMNIELNWGFYFGALAAA